MYFNVLYAMIQPYGWKGNSFLTFSYGCVVLFTKDCYNKNDVGGTIDETIIQCEDPESYIRERCGGRKETYEKSIQKDGSIVFDVYFSGMHQRYTFSEI